MIPTEPIILFEHPGTSAYHDHTIWCPDPRDPMHGIWMKPGQSLAVIPTPSKGGPVSPANPWADAYAYPTVEDYEAISGFKLSEGARIAWDMARAKNRDFLPKPPDATPRTADS